MTAAYRVRQGVRALLSYTRPVDRALAGRYLTPPLLALFDGMRRSEQQHSVRVLRALLARGDVPHALAVAALLHDAGKSRYPFPIWQKTLVVLVRAFAPRLFDRLAAGDPAKPWARPFVVSTRHPAWSGEDIAAAGGDPLAVWLAAHHADTLDAWRDHPQVHLLERLKAADDTH
jgi:hypothetical protein